MSSNPKALPGKQTEEVVEEEEMLDGDWVLVSCPRIPNPKPRIPEFEAQDSSPEVGNTNPEIRNHIKCPEVGNMKPETWNSKPET